ncbi:DUF2867 domain-containing protein [Streptomyces sp. NPDC058221]|uniref:DUF2867 domain-containing protein n=1 Tax=Streptomyces sp. NPDC058221 TaxID=3346388 RepID=UPI0036E772B9
MTSARVHRVEVPQTADAGGSEGGGGLVGAGYASAFELTSPLAGTRTPEEWARAAFEDAPAPLRVVLVLGWRLALGLRLGPRPSPGHVLGWPVAETGPHGVVLEARSGLITARNVVTVSATGVVWSTFVRYERRIARPVWAVVAPVHHLVIPYVLARANRRPRPSGPG